MKADATKVNPTETDKELDKVLTDEDEGGNQDVPEGEETKDEFLKSLLNYRERVRKARGQVRDAKGEYDDLREETRRSKKTWEAAVEHLGEIIDEEPEHLPLFDGQKKKESGVKDEVDPAQEDLAWRSTTIEELGLPTGICDSLRQNPDKSIETLGDLVNWQEHYVDHPMPLTLIPKIGPGKADRIADACEAYWKAG